MRALQGSCKLLAGFDSVDFELVVNAGLFDRAGRWIREYLPTRNEKAGPSYWRLITASAMVCMSSGREGTR